MKGKALVLGAVTVIICTVAQASSIKKWIDADGNVHFGDVPAGNIEAKEVDVKVIKANPDNPRGMLSGSSIDKKRGMRHQEPRGSQLSAEESDYAKRLRRGNAARKGVVVSGMSAKEVERAKGTPLRVNRSAGSGGSREQWVYENKDGSRDYVYLENGKVTGSN
ncbi:MAG: DUF4124 domain-containing protein [Sedimenticola sp.]